MARKKRVKKRKRYKSPGVYMDEVSSGAKPIEGVGTSVAAFIGFARRNPMRAVAAVLVVAIVVWAVRSRRR